MAVKVDDIDRQLLMLIVTNPRISFHELSKKIGITKQAAHHRLKALRESGVIEGMTADISVPYLGAVPVCVIGISRAPSVPKVFEKLEKCEFTRRVIAGCGGYIYVNGILRNMSELKGFVNFVKRAAEFRAATVGLYSPSPDLMPNYVVDGITDRRPSYRKLSPLDLRIIISLKEDVRKPVEKIAKELDVSAKTVRRHLQHMVSEGSIDLHVKTDSPVAGDLMYIVHVNIREGADGAAIGRRLLSKFPFRDAFLVEYSSLPNFLCWIFWTGDISKMREILAAADGDRDIESLMPNLGYMMRIYPTWQDELPRQLLRASDKTETRSGSR